MHHIIQVKVSFQKLLLVKDVDKEIGFHSIAPHLNHFEINGEQVLYTSIE